MNGDRHSKQEWPSTFTHTDEVMYESHIKSSARRKKRVERHKKCARRAKGV